MMNNMFLLQILQLEGRKSKTLVLLVETLPPNASPGCSSALGSKTHLLLLSDRRRQRRRRRCGSPEIALDAGLISWPPVRWRPGANRWALKGGPPLRFWDERAAAVKETGSHSSHLLISRK